jgi:hypothetical protein
MPGHRKLAVLALVTAVGLTLPAAPARGEALSVQSHSMIHTCCTPDGDRGRLMAAAKASGAEIVRLDVEVHGIVYPSESGYRYDFSRLDEVVALGRRHGIRILGILSGTPAGMTDCPPGTPPEVSWRCAPADPDEYARHVVEIMEHAGAGVHAWEFWNEPDERYMYIGSPEVYGRALGVIHALSAGRFPVTSGGIADLQGGLPFLRRAIAAGARFDVGNVHLRGPDLQDQAERAARFFGELPLWVTEHGYPSRPQPEDQVRMLRSSLPALRAGGADQVFVTLRDIDEFGPDSPFASEGIMGKPAWDLVVRLNRQVNELESRRPGRIASMTGTSSNRHGRARCAWVNRNPWRKMRHWRNRRHGRRSTTCLGTPPRTCRSRSGSSTAAGSVCWAAARVGGSATG